MFKKKYMEYKFLKEELNRESKSRINEILVPSTPASSCWWSRLKPFIGGWNSYPHLIKTFHDNVLAGRVPHDELDPSNTTLSTGKGCPAILNILSTSYLVKAPCDAVITVSSDGRYLCNSANPMLSVSSHKPNQFILPDGGDADIFKGKTCLKFEIAVRVNPNNPCVFLPPQYHSNPWYEVAIGSLSDTFARRGGNLNIIVFVDTPTEGSKTYEVKKGDVLCYIWFPEKVKLKYIDNPRLKIRSKWSSKTLS